MVLTVAFRLPVSIVGSILILRSLTCVTADQLSGAALDAYRTAES